MTSKLQEIINESRVGNDATTVKVLDYLVKLSDPNLRSELSPIIYGVVTNARRQATLAVEKKLGLPRTGALEVDPSEGRKKLLEETFYAPNKSEYVRWGEATAEDHLAYAGMQRKMASGLIATAELHEDAAHRIDIAGVKCLFDLEERF